MDKLENNVMYCEVCGIVDDHYDEHKSSHIGSVKHLSNKILAEYKYKKKEFSSNREGVLVFCTAESLTLDDVPGSKQEKCSQHKTRMFVKPNQVVKFTFDISNETNNDTILFIGTQLAHPQRQFEMNDHQYIFGHDPHIMEPKTLIRGKIRVEFKTADIGQYEMPIMFTFRKQLTQKNIIIIREMVILVQDEQNNEPYPKTPYTDKFFEHSNLFFRAIDDSPFQAIFQIPKLLKIILPVGLEEEGLEKVKAPPELKEQLRAVQIATRAIFDEGLTKSNYMLYFHHLLWWEEIIAKINLRKYNMTDVAIEKKCDNTFWMAVPGLAEKRPSLLRGDKVYLQTKEEQTITFESIITDINENSIQISKFDNRFEQYYTPEKMFNVRFMMARVPMERMHYAVSRVFTSKQDCRIFPEPIKKKRPVKPISKFYNKIIKSNEEQRSAVEHIVSKTSDKVPYIVYGPPGTGKTMTIVEAIIQIVIRNPMDRVLVCTDSNMAADHIALMLVRYNRVLNINNFLLRANSRAREWTTLPPELVSFSNGSSYNNFTSVTNDHASKYRILVTTLLHAAKYVSAGGYHRKLQMTHLFIDEAAQAMEPAALVPITGLLSPNGQLVLAGDPQQLGPVCVSKEAGRRGLNISLLERLWKNYWTLYRVDDPNYITTLVKNYRSHPDILKIPNELFYKEKPLQPKAKLDPLSNTSILGGNSGQRAIVFHAVNSREQRMGNAPSYFNYLELALLQKYTNALIVQHNVLPADIGVIAPYIRQVYKMKEWLKNNGYEDIEIGTVESFQGKEKRVILVSTVRANCRLLDYDAKYGLGFLVDDKRFNVALTRAKAKLIIIGNPTCLTRDEKWRQYMGLCKDLDSYFGEKSQQMDRTSTLLYEISRIRFDKCGLSEVLHDSTKEKKKKK